MAKPKNIYDGIRYVKQRDSSSCGPVAIINIFKWLNRPITYEFIHIARHICKWSDSRSYYGGGTYNKDLEQALKYFGIKKTRKIAPSIEDVDKHLDNDGIILLGYWVSVSITGGNNEGHFSLCIGRTPKMYVMVNDGTKNTLCKRSKNTMRDLLKRDSQGYKCWTWFIKK